MENYIKVNEKVIDGHLHIEAWEQDGVSFLDFFDEYIEQAGLNTVNIASLPSGERNVSNNIMIAFYKLAHKNAFAHGGLVYPEYPAPDKMPQGMDFVTQYKELMEIGFDGIKMLEGKPSLHKLIGKDLSCDLFDPFFAELEKDGTHLLFHVNDPEEFWDETKVSQELKDLGWCYCDGTYASNEEVYRQINRVLEKHPNLCVNFAHFFFYSYHPEKLEELFAKYPKLGVDVTPGGEMYIAFDQNREYYKDFFVKYSERIQLGTDSTFPGRIEGCRWLLDRVYRFFATDEVVKGFNDRETKGINLPKEARENIFYKNFERTVGTKPKEINKKALMAYIEKYRCQMTEDENRRVDELIKRFI
ncbi:MAG: amidohydrolase family protein [Clostridia bacterium]|nr:amidohydrolase family protein [Clostridia bacterium]